MLYSIYRGVVRFNLGSAAVGMAEGENGYEGIDIRKKMDRKRVATSLLQDEKQEEKNRKIRKVQKEEARKTEEGVTYGPGTAPIS